MLTLILMGSMKIQ